MEKGSSLIAALLFLLLNSCPWRDGNGPPRPRFSRTEVDFNFGGTAR